jgi:hypothetical protein
MIASMSMERIAITIPEETLKKARGAIRRTRSSLSAYIAKAVAHEVQADEDFDAMLAEMRNEHGGGPMTRAEERAAELALYGPKRRRKSA